jgi:hypothetical protein
MVDVTEISAVVAAAGVIIGVLYYALEFRHQGKVKHLDLFMGLYSIWGTEEMLDAHRRMMAFKVRDYDSLVKEYGPITSSAQVYKDIDRVSWFFNIMGFLVKEKIVEMKMIDELIGYWIMKNWETIKPLAYGWRKEYNIPESYRWFEYLYDELKKREQQKK